MLEVPIVRFCVGVVCGAVGVTCLVLNLEAPLPMGGHKKHLDMGEIFVVRRPLVPFPTICHENARVEDELVGVVHDLLVVIGSGAGVGVRDCVINLPPGNLDGDGGCVCLVEALVVHEPVSIRDHGVGLVQVGEQIQCTGSTIPAVRLVLDPHNPHRGYSGTSTMDLLTHLYGTYIVISNAKWLANDKRFREAYAPTVPIEVAWR